MLEWLIELGIGVDGAPDGCRTPLMVAAEEGNTEAAKLLISAGADPNDRLWLRARQSLKP